MTRAVSFQTFKKGDTGIVYEDDSYKITCTSRTGSYGLNHMYIVTDADGDLLAIDFGPAATKQDKIESLTKFCQDEAITPIKNNPFF